MLYVPNQGHGVRDIDRLVGRLAALHRYSTHGERLPVVSWAYAVRPDRLSVDVESNRVPRRVLVWTARSPTRDFREAHWTSHSCKRSGGTYACSAARPPDGYTAVYAELWFKDPGYRSFPLATVVCIAGGLDGELPDC